DRRKNNSFRVCPGEQGLSELPAGDDVDARAQIDEGFEDGQVAVGLHRVANNRVQRRKGLLDLGEMVSDRVVAVQIKRRAHAGGHRRNLHVLAEQLAVFKFEIMHYLESSSSAFDLVKLFG